MQLFRSAVQPECAAWAEAINVLLQEAAGPAGPAGAGVTCIFGTLALQSGNTDGGSNVAQRLNTALDSYIDSGAFTERCQIATPNTNPISTIAISSTTSLS